MLTAAKKALTSGVEYFNGSPALPDTLAALLTVRCDHCGHATLEWGGPIARLDAQIADLDARIAAVEGSRRAHRAEAEALLGGAARRVPAETAG